MLAYRSLSGRLHHLGRFAVATLVIAGLIGALSTVLRAFPVGGRAFGVHVQNVGFLLGAPVSFGPAPLAEQPPGGGTDSDSAATINVAAGLLGNTPVLSAGPVTVTTTGSAATNTSSSTATVNNLALLTNLFSATTVSATCSLGATGFQGGVTFAGTSSILGGFPTGAFTSPGANTLLDIPGLGTVILNEQTYSIVGGMRVFSVNAMRVTLSTGLLGATGSMIIGHAECAGTLPTVTAIVPTSGPTGTAVTITGTNFYSPATVAIGGLAATSVSVSNATTITAVVPAQLPAGAWDVVVSTPVGPGTLVDGFTSTNVTPLTPVGGSSYGTRLSLLDALLAGLSLGPIPTIDIPVSTTPGNLSDLGLGVNVPGIPPLPAPFLNVSAFDIHTETDPAAGTVFSRAHSAGANIGGGLLATGDINATCNFGPSGFSGSVTIAGLQSSLLGGLSAFGNPAPNTGLSIAGLGTVILNEQIDATSAGVRRLTVNAIHLDIAPLGLSLGELVLGQATCAAAVPTALTIVPNTGTTAGGTTTVITGTNFALPATVDFGGTPAASVTVDSSTQITAVTPVHAAGNVAVAVGVPAGTANVPGGFTFVAIPGPIATSLSPTSGTTAGGTTVVITGTSFVAPATVTFDGINATSVTVDSATQITVTTPAHAAGNVAVVVTTIAGTASVPGGYTYVTPTPGPTVSSITPTSGTTLGGTSTVITGTNFTGTTSVTFGGTEAASFTVDSATQITAVTPAHAAGNVAVIVTTPGGTASVPGGFTFVEPAGTPTATSIVPATGTTAGGTSTVITGTNFTGATSVTFDGIAAASFTVDSATQITASTPPHAAGNVAVQITTPGGSATVPGGFTFVAPGGGTPTASSIVPASGPTTGGTSTVITGTNFVGATSVTFDGSPASFTVDTATQITASSPAHAATGNVAVVVTTPGGTATVPGGFTYTAAPAPDLSITVTGPTSISPGGTLVYTIQLTNGGTADATGAIVTIPSLVGLTGPVVSGGGCVASPCTLNVATGATVTITATYTLPSSYAGPNPISATFTATLPADPAPGDNSFTLNTPVVPVSDISLLMSVDNAAPNVGSTILFTITATNTGPADASGIEVIDQLPVGLTFVNATPSQGSYDPMTGRWSAGALVNGAQATLLLSATVANAGAITNTATRTGGNQLDPDSSDNIAAITVNGQPIADVRVGMTASQTSVPFGSNVSFTVTVTNVGPSTATGVVVTDLLPSSLIFVNALQNQGSYNNVNGVWTIGTLASGAEVSLIITATVNAVGPIVNNADKTAQVEPDPAPNTDHASVTINGTGADLQLVMTSTPAPAPPGATVTVDLTLTNLGPDGATGVGVPGAMPGGLIFVSASAEQGTYDPGTNFWTVGTMPAAGPDGEARLRLVGIVPGGGVNQTSGTAEGDQADPNLLNNNPGPLPPSSGPVDLAASISMTGTFNTAGNPVSFSLGATNVGTGPSVGPISLQLALPPNVQVNSAPVGWTCNLVGQVYTCTHNNLSIAPTQQVVAVVGGVVTIAGSNATPITLTVLYPPDQNLANNVASIPVSPGGDTADLTVTQTATEAPFLTVTYQLTVTNNGPTIATAVQLTDSLPATFTLTSTSPGSITCTGTTTLVCSLGTMGAGASVALTVKGTVPQKGSITNIAVVTSGVSDSNNANNISSLTTMVQGAPDTTCPGDSDCDGMPDTCENQFGLDPNFDDSGLDPDGDGRTNLQECTDGTHPRGFFTQIYAEGATGSFFDTTFALVNTNATTTSKTLVRMLEADGHVTSQFYAVPPKQRLALTAASLLGSGSAVFSTTVESDVPVASSRTMLWDPTDYGMSLGIGAPSASTTWYFAEGSTLGEFQLYFLLVNPSETLAKVTATFLKLDGSTVVWPVDVGAHSRVTIDVKSIPGLGNTDVGAVFTSDRPVVVERSMYLNHGRVFEAGDAVTGVAQPTTDWFIAEGAHSAFFDYFLLLANPGTQSTTVTARYQREDGQTVTKFYTLPPTSRKTINVGGEDALLTGQAVSTNLSATNPIVAERAMWWPGPALSPRWYGGHQTMGSTQTSVRWAIAAGTDGGPADDRTFVLIANQNATLVQAKVTVIFDDGTSAEKVLALPATSRTTVNIGGDFPSAANRTFSVIVESIGAGAPPISVDVSRYRSGGGQFWAAGSSSSAVAVP